MKMKMKMKMLIRGFVHRLPTLKSFWQTTHKNVNVKGINDTKNDSGFEEFTMHRRNGVKERDTCCKVEVERTQNTNTML